MREKHDDKRLDALRERLYARGQEPQHASRVPLHDEKTEIPTAWESAPPPAPAPLRSSSDDLSMSSKKQKYSYRFKILLTAIVFFVAAVMLSSLFIAFGGNAISGDNINIKVNGPFTVGGGEEMPLQIGITNNNSVAIESATLIVEYPDGTQSVTEEGKQLFIDRIPRDSIGSGETVNRSARAFLVKRTKNTSFAYPSNIVSPDQTQRSIKKPIRSASRLVRHRSRSTLMLSNRSRQDRK